MFTEKEDLQVLVIIIYVCPTLKILGYALKVINSFIERAYLMLFTDTSERQAPSRVRVR